MAYEYNRNENHKNLKLSHIKNYLKKKNGIPVKHEIDIYQKHEK